MADVTVGGSLAYGGLRFLTHLWGAWKKHRIGVYGYWGTGKSTLNRQMATAGELEVEDEAAAETSTYHAFSQSKKKYVLPPASRKRISLTTPSLGSIRRTIVSADIGGHMEYFDLWLEDMVSRDVQVVIWLIDHRHLMDPADVTQQIAFSRFVDAIVNGNYPRFRSRRLRRKAKKYKPEVVGLIANKADLWMHDDWKDKFGTPRMGEHPIFEPFRGDLIKIQRQLMVPTLKRACSALYNWNVELMIWNLLQAKP